MLFGKLHNSNRNIQQIPKIYLWCVVSLLLADIDLFLAAIFGRGRKSIVVDIVEMTTIVSSWSKFIFSLQVVPVLFQSSFLCNFLNRFITRISSKSEEKDLTHHTFLQWKGKKTDPHQHLFAWERCH